MCKRFFFSHNGSREKDEQIYSNLNLALEAEESESDRYMNMTGLSSIEDDKDHDDKYHHYASLNDIYTKPQSGSETQTPKCLSDDGGLTCPLCEKKFRSKQSFKIHRYRFHTKDKLLQQSLIALT